MTWWLLALSVVVVLLAIVVVGLLQSHAAIVRALHEMGADFTATPGSELDGGATTGDGGVGMIATPTGGSLEGIEARDVIGTDLDGNPIAIPVTHVTRQTLLAFLSSGCLTCHGFWEGFSDPRSRAEVVGDVTVVAVTKGVDAEVPAAVAKLAGPQLTTVMSTEAWDDYSVPVAPYFLLVDGSTNRVIGEGSAATFAQLGGMLERATSDVAEARRRANTALSRRDLLGAVGDVVDLNVDAPDSADGGSMTTEDVTR